MKSVASRDNPAFKAMMRLVSSAAERKRSGLSVLDGTHLLAAFMDAGGRPEQVMVSRAGLDDPEVARLAKRAAPAPVVLLSDTLFAAVSTVESPTGIVASVRTPAPRRAPDDARLVLLLEDIQDPGNVGTLLRSAAAAGAGHVLLSPRCAFAWSPKVLRAAMGAHFLVNVVEGADLAGYVERFAGQSVALAGEGGVSLFGVDLRKPTAILVGNEGAGLSARLRAAATLVARIPMAAGMESLNAATAGAVALFEAARQRAFTMNSP